ncbi:MAG: site-specific integrase [Bryobacteraceae bacterium]
MAKKRSNTAGSIFQRKDGRWVAIVDLGWVNGKRARKSFYAPTRKEVQEQLTRALADIQNGLPVVREKQTVGAHLAWWLEEVVKRKNRPTTYRSYEQLVRLHLDPVLGKIPLLKLTTQHVRSLLNQKQDGGLSSRTVQYLHAVLRKALNLALKDQLVIRNVASLVEPPRVVAKEVQPLTPDEARSFLGAVQADRLEALYAVAVALGLRQGEALALRWRDIDLEKGRLRVRFALQRFTPKSKEGDARAKCQLHLVEPKTRKSRRTIDLPQVTLNSLAAHHMRQAEERKLAGSRWTMPTVHCEGKMEAVDDFVFTTGIGTPLEGRRVTQRFQAILKNCKIPNHRFHDLRHTAATLLAVQGVHPKAIQSVLGWDQVSMVDRYAHFVDEMRKDAATKMDAILKPVAVNVAVKPLEVKPS